MPKLSCRTELGVIWFILPFIHVQPCKAQNEPQLLGGRTADAGSALPQFSVLGLTEQSCGAGQTLS